MVPTAITLSKNWFSRSIWRMLAKMSKSNVVSIRSSDSKAYISILTLLNFEGALFYFTDTENIRTYVL